MRVDGPEWAPKSGAIQISPAIELGRRGEVAPE